MRTQPDGQIFNAGRRQRKRVNNMDLTRLTGRGLAAWLAALALALWSVHAGAGVTVRVDAQPVSDPIEVFVDVTDTAGAPVSGLQAADFTILVDGTAVSAPTFSLPASQDPNQRVSVVFAMDMSQSVKQAALAATQQAVIDFINSMQVGDYAAIVMFNKTNENVASVVQSFVAIDGPGGTNTNKLLDAAMTNYLGSGSNILDGVKLSIDQITSSTTLPAGPKAVLLVSDGREGDPPGSTTPYADVITAANSADIPVFTVGVGDVNADGLELLTSLATDTNATYLAAPTPEQIAQAYVAIANTLNNEYLLTFTSSISDCGNHSLEVRVTGQSAVTQTFVRCTSTGGGGGGGGDDGGGGGGGGLGIPEIALGTLLMAMRRRRFFASRGTGLRR
jgi:VWFA-related protein